MVFAPSARYAGFVQRVDPHLPVLAAHDRHGVVDFLLRGGGQVKILHFLLVGIHAFLHGISTDRLERGVVHDAGDRVLPARRRQAVDHQVDLAQIGLDGGYGFLLDLIAERIAIDALGIQAGGPGIVVEGGGVVPAGRTGLCCRCPLSQRKCPAWRRRNRRPR